MTVSASVRDRLAAAVVAGEQLDLHDASDGADGTLLDEEVMRGWGPDRELAASDLAELVRAIGLPDGTTAHPRGVQLRGVRIRGRLDLDFVPDALPLRLTDCLLDHGVELGVAQLPHLTLRRCRITHPTNTPFSAAGARIADGLVLRSSVVTAPMNAPVAVDLTDSVIGHRLDCAGADISTESGPALSADGCEIGGGVFLTGGCTVRGAGERGAVRLVGARITGQLNARGATLTNDSGPALNANLAQVGGGVFLTGGCTVRGAGERGAVRLVGVGIGGQLNADGATLTNDSGHALSADGCEIGGGVFLTGGCTVRGAGEQGAVRLLGARITGQLNADGATLTNDSGIALDLQDAQVSDMVFLNGRFTADSGGELVTVNLSYAQLGPLRINNQVTHATDPQRRWRLDGCTYRGLPRPNNTATWLALIEKATPAYAAQPYQHLAAAHRAAGHDHHVRTILIAQRRDQIRRGDLSRRDAAWARFTGVVLGYGWQPWRALIGLAAVFLTSIVLAIALGQHGALAHPPRTSTTPTDPAGTTLAATPTGEPCAIVERIGVGLDLGTPLLGTATKSRDRCPIAPTGATATALLVSTWILQFLAWALGALFVVGFTGAVRKT